MSGSDKAPLQPLQLRQTMFNRAQLGATYEYATDLPASDSYGDGIGRAIISELVDGDEVQAADEVFRRLENISDDVSAFFRALYAVHYGHLGVEGTLAEINQILSRLNEERLEHQADEMGFLPLHDPNYVIVNTSHAYYVLPGEEPKTFATLDSLAEAIASLINEHGHVLGQTLQVYRLCPIAQEQAQLKARVEIKLSELEAETETAL